MSYDGSATKRSTVEVRSNPLAEREKPRVINKNDQPPLPSPANDWPKLANGKPDFDQMTASQRNAYHSGRLKRTYG